MVLTAMAGFPAAVQNGVFRRLSSQDLKRLRLVCRGLDFAARRSLFWCVWLRANIDSFRRLDLISRHPILCEYVAVIHHSGEMVCEFDDFDEWNDHLGGMHQSENSRDALREQFTWEDLHYYYLKYRHHIEGQIHINAYDNAELLLLKALKKLPHIVSVEFASNDAECEGQITEHRQFSSLNTIGQETVSEPCNTGGRKHHTKQFITLLQAASQSCRFLNIIKGYRLQWDIFERPDQLRTMVEAVRYIQHLVLGISNYPVPDTQGHRQKLSRLLSKAPDLKTLELYFGRVPAKRWDHIIELSQLLTYRSCWMSLKRLVLQGFCTTESEFRTFLESHLELKFLGLSNMDFSLIEMHKFRVPGGSFCSLIRFLHSTMDLDYVKFSGTFCNHWDERWIASWDKKYEDDPTCLKSRIESWIVYSGVCPLEAPDQNDEWHLRGDASWRYDYNVSEPPS